MTYLGFPYHWRWPVSVHLDRLRRAAALFQSIPSDVDRLALIADRAAAMLLLGEPAGWDVAANWDASADTPAARSTAAGHSRSARATSTSASRRHLGPLCRGPRAGRQSCSSGPVTASHNCGAPPLVAPSSPGLARWSMDWAGRADCSTCPPRRAPSRPHRRDGDRGRAARRRGRHPRRRRTAPRHDPRPGAGTDLARRLAGGGSRPRPCAVGRRAGGRAAGRDRRAVWTVSAKGIWVWATDLAPARVVALTAAGRVDEAARFVATFARGLRGRDAPAPRAACGMSGAAGSGAARPRPRHRLRIRSRGCRMGQAAPTVRLPARPRAAGSPLPRRDQPHSRPGCAHPPSGVSSTWGPAPTLTGWPCRWPRTAPSRVPGGADGADAWGQLPRHSRSPRP